MSPIKGIHHVAVKPRKSQYEAVMKFYTELLELPVECKLKTDEKEKIGESDEKSGAET